jgi:hypothetical protein
LDICSHARLERRARWWLSGDNDKVVAHSGESFDSAYDATRACENSKSHQPAWAYDVYADTGGNYR